MSDRPIGTENSSDLLLSRYYCLRRLVDFVGLLDDLRHACPDFLQKYVGFHDEREEMLIQQYELRKAIKGGGGRGETSVDGTCGGGR